MGLRAIPPCDRGIARQEGCFQRQPLPWGRQDSCESGVRNLYRCGQAASISGPLPYFPELTKQNLQTEFTKPAQHPLHLFLTLHGLTKPLVPLSLQAQFPYSFHLFVFSTTRCFMADKLSKFRVFKWKWRYEFKEFRLFLCQLGFPTLSF